MSFRYTTFYVARPRESLRAIAKRCLDEAGRFLLLEPVGFKMDEVQARGISPDDYAEVAKLVFLLDYYNSYVPNSESAEFDASLAEVFSGETLSPALFDRFWVLEQYDLDYPLWISPTPENVQRCGGASEIVMSRFRYVLENAQQPKKK